MPFFFTLVCMVALDVPGMAVYTHPFSPGSDFLVITQEPEQKLSSRPHRSTSTENMKAVWSSRRYNGPEVPSTSPNSHPHPYILVFHNLNCHLQPVQPMAREQRRTGGSKAVCTRRFRGDRSRLMAASRRRFCRFGVNLRC